ncbi:MAG: hypothetical protein KKB79_01395 [Nanoarchaeota archaeon]|nr:hypothetical protein [Nanoarchaeota archaeon]
MKLKNKAKTSGLVLGLGLVGLATAVGCGPKEKPNLEDYEGKEFTYIGNNEYLFDYNTDGNMDAIVNNKSFDPHIVAFAEGERDSVKFYRSVHWAIEMTPEMRNTANELAKAKWRLEYLLAERRYELSQEGEQE